MDKQYSDGYWTYQHMVLLQLEDCMGILNI
jgi:hypothetical protein